MNSSQFVDSPAFRILLLPVRIILTRNYDHTRMMFKLRGKKPIVTQQNIRPVIDYINSVLAIQYGIKISAQGKGKVKDQKFMIKHHHPFDESLRPKKIALDEPVESLDDKVEIPVIEWTANDEAWLAELIEL